MHDSEEYKELGIGKGYHTSIERTMSDHSSIEENIIGTSTENFKKEASEIQTLTQETVNEQIGGFIAPLTRQLEKLTRLVLVMVTTQHPNHYPRTDFGTTSRTATYQCDIRA